MVYVISLEKQTDVRFNLWSHEVLGVVSSEFKISQVLLDLTLEQFPHCVQSIDAENLLYQLTDAFSNREDKTYFKYTFEVEGEFKGNFYVDLVQVYE